MDIQDSSTQEPSKSRNMLYLVLYVFILIALTGGAIVYGIQTKPTAPTTQDDTEPTPSIAIKFTGESELGPCNATMPLCGDETYECFKTLTDKPCSSAVQGSACADTNEIPGDNICHHKCESDTDCSEGYTCLTISGFSGEAGKSYSLCVEEASSSAQLSEPAPTQ